MVVAFFGHKLIRWWLLIGLCVSASASAHRNWFRHHAKFHRSQYRLVFPNFPPADFSAKDTAKLVLGFEKKFDLTTLHLAWNGKSRFSNGALRRNATWVSESAAGAVLEINLNFLFESEKQSFHKYVRDCFKRNGRFEIWWRAPVRLLTGELLWGRDGIVKAVPVSPMVVLDQVAPSDWVNPGSTVALRFHAAPVADTFECAVNSKIFTPCRSPLLVTNLKAGWLTVLIRAKTSEVVGPVLRYDAYLLGHAAKLVLQKAEPGSFIFGSDFLSLAFVDTSGSKKARTFSCQLDNDKLFACKSPLVLKGLAEGGHIVTIRATKPSLLEAPLVYAFLVARSQPVLSVSRGPAELSNQTTASFEFASDRAATFRCAIDGGEASVCTSPWTLKNLAEGEHKVAIYAVDELGGTSPSYEFRFKIDLTAPQFSFAADPNVLILNRGNLVLSFSALEPLSALACQLDGAALASCGSPLVLANVADGTHRLVVSGQDLAGNAGQFSYDFSVDSQGPMVQVQRSAPVASPSNQTVASFSFSASESSTYLCSLDAGVAAPCESPISFSLVSEGQHQLVVVAQDVAGNQTTASAVWEVDLSAPIVSLDFVIAADTVTESTSLSLDVLSEPSATLFYQLDGGAELPFSSPLLVNDLFEGRHRLQLRARDLAGNISPSVVYEWTVAMTATVALVAVTNPGPVTAAQENEFSFTGQHAVEFRCALDDAAFAPCQSPHRVSGLTDAAHLFAVKAVNVAGAEGAAVTFAWTVAAPAATVVLSSTVSEGEVSANQTASFAFSSNGSDFECALDAAAFSPCSSPYEATALMDGAHSFKIFARNLRGQAGQVSTLGWKVQTPAAVVTLGVAAPSQSVTNLDSMVLSFSVTNAGSVSCALDGQLPLPCASPVSFNLLGDGAHSISIFAASAGGSVGQAVSYAWSVDRQGPVVTIDSTTPSTSPTATVFLTANFHADDAAAIFLCGLDGAVPVACSSPWTAAVTADGAHAIAIWAVDVVGNQSIIPATYNWTVDRSFTCSNFSVAQITATQASVNWRTTVASTSVVRYGLGNNRGSTATGQSNVTQHSVLVTSLAPSTFYSAQGQSSTVDGRNCQTSPVFFTTRP